MKKALLFFAIAGFAAIAQGAPPAGDPTAHAAAGKQKITDPGAQENPKIKRAAETADGRPVENSAPRIPAKKLTPPHRPAIPLPKSPAINRPKASGPGSCVSSSKPPAAATCLQPPLKQPGIAAAPGTTMLNRLVTLQPVKPAPKLPVATGPVTRLPGGLRKSVASTAAVFQPAHSKAGGLTAGISGMDLKHKH